MKFTTPIEHVVVLMMENHSFDNMLGWWSGELTGDESNESAEGVCYTTGEEQNPPFATNPCPGHAFDNVTFQIFGTQYPSTGTSPPDPQPLAPADPQPLAPPDPQPLANMSGFVRDYERIPGAPPGAVMGCYSAKQLPVMTTLANSFTVCSRWFSSVPGPTAPNRIYANCASSRGYAGTAYNNLPSELADLPSIFSMLDKTKGAYSWGIYYESSAFVTEHVLAVLNKLGAPKYLDPGFNCFLSQILKGDLPNYCFLTPGLMPNSQHPNSDVRYGECVMANIYEMIANSSYWEKTLFIITYDEHGGFYDSVPPPKAVNPDGKVWGPPDYPDAKPQFAFDRLGVRVPALLISPYVAARIDATQYEHSSIPATVAKLFGLSWPVTTNQRINTVNTFETAIGCELRTDLPTILPRPPATYIPLPAPAVLG